MKLTDKFFSLFKRDALLFLSTLITGVVIARKLGPEMMGVWSILLLIPGYAEAFFRFKFEHSSIYFLSKNRAGFGEMAFLLHVVAFVVSIIVFCGYLLGFEFVYASIFSNVTQDVALYAYAVFLLFPLRLVYLNYSYLLIAHEDVSKYNVVVVLQALTTSVLSILLIVFMDYGIAGAIAGNMAGLILSIAYGAYLVQGLEKIKPKFDLALLVDAWCSW